MVVAVLAVLAATADSPTIQQLRIRRTLILQLRAIGLAINPSCGLRMSGRRRFPSPALHLDSCEGVKLRDLLREFGFDAIVFSSAEDFLSSDKLGQTKCLILDVAIPGISGPELQQELIRRRESVPIIFITAQGDALNREQASRYGAMQFLNKPFSDTALLAALKFSHSKMRGPGLVPTFLESRSRVYWTKVSTNTTVSDAHILTESTGEEHERYHRLIAQAFLLLYRGVAKSIVC